MSSPSLYTAKRYPDSHHPAQAPQKLTSVAPAKSHPFNNDKIIPQTAPVVKTYFRAIQNSAIFSACVSPALFN
jgi:hypothetical protein